MLALNGASWLDNTGHAAARLRTLSGGSDGELIILSDRSGMLSVETSGGIHLDGAGFFGPDTLTLLVIVVNSRTQAIEPSRKRY